MSVILPPNSTGTTLDTQALVSGKERIVGGLPYMTAIHHNPAAATQATISAPAGAAGVCNVCHALSWNFTSGGTAETTDIAVNLRDGATGAGTILMSWSIFDMQTNSHMEVSLSGLNIKGTAATAMTLEFSAAGDATTVQSVNLVYSTTA